MALSKIARAVIVPVGEGSIDIARGLVLESGAEPADRALPVPQPPCAVADVPSPSRDQPFRVQAASPMKFDINPEGWVHWPEREDFSLEFMRLMAAAQEGGSTVSECWLTASRVDFADDNSWYREWTRTADANNDRAVAAFAQGNVLTASRNWLRAMNYYQAATYPFDFPGEHQRAAVAAMRQCAANYLQHRDPPGEIVSVPWFDGLMLQGYYLPAPTTATSAPAVICIGEPGQRKEEYLFKLARHAAERGISLLAVDVWGDDIDTPFETVVGRHKIESAIGHFMDYLSDREDVDQSRIAILADGCGSSFVARGIAFDRRFAAAVCDGGVWDFHERSFLKRRTAGPEADGMLDLESSRILRNIACPLLVTIGARGWLEPDRVAELIAPLRTGRRDVTLKIFEATETAAAQGHLDNPTLANEFIFDWIASRLRRA